MAPIIARLSTAHVNRNITPAQTSEALRNAARPRATTSTASISPAIGNRMVRMTILYQLEDFVPPALSSLIANGSSRVGDFIVPETT